MDYPVTTGAFDTSYNGSGAGAEVGDVFMTVLSSDPAGPISLSTSTDEISTSLGGVVDFVLNAGSDHGARNYLVLGTLSGTTPGGPLPGDQATASLNWDAFTEAVRLLLETPVFTGFYGLLDGSGAAEARITAAPISPSFSGALMQFAFVLNNPFDFVSNSALVELVP